MSFFMTSLCLHELDIENSLSGIELQRVGKIPINSIQGLCIRSIESHRKESSQDFLLIQFMNFLIENSH